MSKPRTALLLTILAAVLAAPAAADWLVTESGRLIETHGPWAVDGERLIYVDTQGAEHVLAVDKVDLEASEEMTAISQGREYVAKKTSAAADDDEASGDEAAAEAPQIILYQTSWCGYCRKAQKLLKDLDADFVAKDIERDRDAAAEHRRKGRGYRGIPLIAYGDAVLRGYDERRIRKMVEDQKSRSES